MKYSKKPLSFSDQVAKLQSRGLIIQNVSFAESTLSHISYYRLRAYTYPFQDNNDPNHPFIGEVKFEEIVNLYNFDSLLRMLIFQAIEKIEIAVRTQVVYNWSLTKGSHWQSDPSLFRNNSLFKDHTDILEEEINRSNEVFIEHYYDKYTTPDTPPSWMSLEICSLGLTSKLFSNLKKGPEKAAVTRYFGLNNIALLENWLYCFSHIRNICAHHGRLWNRRISAHIDLPTHPRNLFISDHNVLPYKIYPAICCIGYVLDIIDPENKFKKELISLMNECPLRQDRELGFTLDWRNDPFWR